jgi:hypothetical protein
VNADDISPVELGVMLSLLPAMHPILLAARLGIEIGDMRREHQQAMRDASPDIAAGWPRDYAHRWISHEEIRRRRAA